jgi:lipid A disaccharide synthetase
MIANQIVENFALAHPEFRERLEKIKVQKEAMIEQIKELLEDSGSNHSANLIRELQKEWKKLGSIGIQDSELQKEWKNINDDFFTRRRDQLEIQEQARKNNLQKKILLCEEAERLIENLNDENREEAKNHVKHLRRLWKEIGAVPRRHSDKIWKRFNKACDTIFENHQSNATDMD